MKQNDIQIKFQGFQPPEIAAHQIQKTLAEIYDEAPYGAVLRATFIYHGGAYRGVLNINSSAAPFFAVASDTNLRALTDRLFVQIRRQLEKWKSHRFNLTSPREPTNFYYQNQLKQKEA